MQTVSKRQLGIAIILEKHKKQINKKFYSGALSCISFALKVYKHMKRRYEAKLKYSQ